MKITPRYTGYKKIKEQEAPPVQKTAAPAPTVRKSEKPQPIIKPISDKTAKVEKHKAMNAEESQVEIKKEKNVEVPKKRSLLEEVLEEQANLED